MSRDTRTTYEVSSDSGYGNQFKERAFGSLQDAERFARWHAARRAIRVRIDCRTEWLGYAGRARPEPMLSREHVATVGRDAFGRLWTDLMPAGAELL